MVDKNKFSQELNVFFMDFSNKKPGKVKQKIEASTNMIKLNKIIRIIV